MNFNSIKKKFQIKIIKEWKKKYHFFSCIMILSIICIKYNLRKKIEKYIRIDFMNKNCSELTFKMASNFIEYTSFCINKGNMQEYYCAM